MEDKMQWFVVNVHTGCEDKVARQLREQIDKRRLNAYFGEILVPTREVAEIKGNKRVVSEKKFFPGYIVVQMVMNNETFSLVKLMPQVVMFLGQKVKNQSKPIPPFPKILHTRSGKRFMLSMVRFLDLMVLFPRSIM